MSLLKLLFDLPDAGGDSNFTAEEQEELMAFEHNLDEHLEAKFALQANDGSLAFLQGAALQDVPPQHCVEGITDCPVANGVYSSQEDDRADGVKAEKVSEGSIRIDMCSEKGDKLGNSTTADPTLGSVEENAPLNNTHVLGAKHQGTGRALWVKWRGKWQAGIQSSLEDCRAATVKAMPTHGKKEFLLVYLVSARFYVWMDAQKSCPISETPEPLSTGTHDEWRQMVADTGAPRRRMFLSLGWEMLDISDRLHILGVVERARSVSVWKEFAKEATEASKYSELGSLLTRIQAVVEPIYIRQSWLEKRLKVWTEECLKAETAATIEKLTKELIRVILWDEAADLWDAPTQPVLDPGWTDWKGTAFDELTNLEDASPVPVENSTQPSTPSSLTPKVEKEGKSASKRARKSEGVGKPKGESNCAQPLSSEGRISTRKQSKRDKAYDASPSSSAAVEHSPAALNLSSLCPETFSLPVEAIKTENAVDHALQTTVVAPEMQLKIEACDAELSQDAPLNSASYTWKRKSKSEYWGCSAFLKSRKRRCPRPAWRGIYCEKHQGLAENPPVVDSDVEPSQLCMARYERVENRRCANFVAEGSYYCDVHAQMSAILPPEVSEGLSDVKHELEEHKERYAMGKQLRCNAVTIQGTQCAHMVKDGQRFCVKHTAKDPDQVAGDTLAVLQDGGTAVKTEQHDQSTIAVGGRCVGRTRRSDQQCLHRAKFSSKYCKKHLKGSHAGLIEESGKSGASEGVFGDKEFSKLIGDLSMKDRRSFSRARNLLCKYMNAGLSRSKGVNGGVHCSKKLDWVVEEATKDFPSGEMLLKILLAEKKRLSEMVLEEGIVNKKSSNIIWRNVVSAAADTPSLHTESSPPKLELETAEVEVVASYSTGASQSAVSPSQMETVQRDLDFGVICGLCSQKFEQLSVLGKHWKEQHKREACLFEKYMICRVCEKNSEDFRNEEDIVRHWRMAHPKFPMTSPGWSVCLMCDKQCSDFDHLWQHVEDQHHCQLSSTEFAGRIIAALMSQEGRKCCFCSEIFPTLWELQYHKEVNHKEQELRYTGMKRNSDIMDNEVTGHNSKDIDTISAEIPYRFACRFCGIKFRLLPELGRHHQAEHRTQIAHGTGGKSPALGKRKRKSKQEGFEGDWPATPVGMGEGADKEVYSKKWRNRARTKAKNFTRGRAAPMKKQSGGAEAILLRMKAVQQVLEEQQIERPPRKRDRKAESARRVARLAENGETLPPKKFKCRLCGLQFPSLLDLGQHHQTEHSMKQAFVTNDLGECQTGIFTLSKDGILVPSQGEKLKRCPNSMELLEVARSACCKDWLANELGKKYKELPLKLFVQAAHLCSEAKIEIQWHQKKYVCPDGCKAYGALDEPVTIMEVNLDDVKEPEVDTLTVPSKSVNLNRVVMLEDLSNGLERVPIACVIDEDAMEPCPCSLCNETGSSTGAGDSQPWKNFVYITQRHLDPSLGFDTKNTGFACSCTGEECSATTCDHVSTFDNDNAKTCTNNGEPLRGRFPYDSSGRIILEVGYKVYECNSGCQCKEACQNRILQKGVCVKLEVFKSRHKGWAVRAAEPIARGTFICEYVGEVLNNQEAEKRGQRYDKVSCSYFYNSDPQSDVSAAQIGSKPFVIDATKYGNVARFINHSCEPNLINYEVLVESTDHQLAHIGFFANRDIARGEELAYDYRYKLLPGKGYPCHCGAPSCRGRLD